MYTPETRLDFGKYKTAMLLNVPAHYLITLYKSHELDDKPDLMEYVKTNYFSLLDEAAKKTQVISVAPLRRGSIDARFSGFLCNKRAFPTKKDAMSSIIQPAKRRNGKSPVRAYECPKCSQWHLTSKSVEDFKETVKKFNNN